MFIALGCSIPVILAINALEDNTNPVVFLVLFMPIIFLIAWLPAKYGLIDVTKG